MTTVNRRGIFTTPPYFSPIRLGAAGIVAFSVILTGGWIAVAIGAALAIVIPFVSPPYWFTGGQVAAIGLVTEIGGLPLLVIEAGLVTGFVLTTMSETDIQTGTILLVVIGLWLAIGWGSYLVWETLWSMVGLLGALTAVTLYLLHRYELVRLGIVGEQS